MLKSIFYFVLNMSITSAAVIIIILALRAVLGRKISKTAVYCIWGIVLFRLLIPVSIPSSLSIINLIGIYNTKTVEVPKAYNAMPDVSMINSVKAADEYFPLKFKYDLMERIFSTAGVIWACVTVLLVITAVIIYRITALQLKKAVIIKENEIFEMCRQRLRVKSDIKLYESDLVESPVVFGSIKPRIIVPKGIRKEGLEYILMHELVHIRRGDNFWRIIAVFAVCIHWFNPFAWLFLHLSGEDMEIACDEGVLRNIDGEGRKAYANTLASLAGRQKTPLVAFGGTASKKRILKIISYKQISLGMAAFTAALCIILAVLLLTNPVLRGVNV